jgi:hypothetical protein
MRTVNYKHDIGDSVLIKDVNANGRVDSLSTDRNGQMYRIVFWMNGDRKAEWMYDWELEQLTTKEQPHA